MDFLELRQVFSTYDWDLRDPLWWPQERPVPMQLHGGSRDSSPVDAGPWDLVWSLCRILRIPLQC